MHLAHLVLCLACAAANGAAVSHTLPPTPNPVNGDAALQKMVDEKAWIWHWARDGSDRLVTHSVYEYALALCESGRELDRLGALLSAGASLQDRDPESRTYGNFRWYAKDREVVDPNAVEFCMRHAVPIWILHADVLEDADRAVLRETLEIAITGCLNHYVPRGYTNIGFMRSLNLILLGEALDKPDVAEAGYRFLDEVTGFIHDYGIQEYVSPTYHAVSIGCLYELERFAQSERARTQATRMLDLLWTDVAANWHPRSAKLTGAFSRTYNYLSPGGGINTCLACAGWTPDSCEGLVQHFARWNPGQQHWALAHQFPRLVRQRWGGPPAMTRTSYLAEDIVLSASGAAYSNMDQPLVVDFPARPGLPRAYFIADAREDPYGSKKIPSFGHQKAEHTAPLWIASQRSKDALGIALYREQDVRSLEAPLRSHFVLPRGGDRIWIAGTEVDLAREGSWEYSVALNQAVVLRCGTAAVGIKVLHAAGASGAAAPVALVFDGNDVGALRLSVLHATTADVSNPVVPSVGAALWIRVGSMLSDDEFTTWAARFEKTTATTEIGLNDLSLAVMGDDGPLKVLASIAPFRQQELVPAPTASVLEVNGEDLAARILADLPAAQPTIAGPRADHSRTNKERPGSS